MDKGINKSVACPECGESKKIGYILSIPAIQSYTRWQRLVAWIKHQELPFIFYPSTYNLECMKCGHEWGFANE